GTLIPFVVFDLTLKILDVAKLPTYNSGFAWTLELIQSDVFFDLGYVLLWVGLFAVVRRGRLRWILVVLFQVVTLLAVLVTTCAHWYFQETGAVLDSDTISEWFPKFKEIVPILVHDAPLSTWVLLLGALLYTALGPWLATFALKRWWWRGRSPAVRSETSFFAPLGFLLLALSLGYLSLLAAPNLAGTNALFATDPFINVVLMGAEKATTEDDNLDAGPAGGKRAAHAALAETPQTEKRNVVLVHLESTRAQSVTPYNEGLKTTPFLDELAKSSLLAERAHVVVPRSSKATVAVNCGIEPALYPGPEFGPEGIPARCLAHLLKEQGYRTVFFTSVSNAMDNFWDEVKNLGYEDYYSSESMNSEGFQVTNTFGYEEDIMLKPSEEWLRAHKDKPFFAEYMTGTGHYGYECVPNRYGTQDFAEDEQLNRYLNCLHYLDSFVKNLIDQYKELGLYENTIFVFFGDRGEGFGEHGRFMHGDTIWEEGLRIPLIIHAPGWFTNGEQARGLSSETDILPTVLEMLGYEVKDGEYAGYSLLHPLPEDRTLRFSCITNRMCLASIKGSEKYIYHYDHQPEEVFDLSEDPLEEHNIASLYSKEELDRWREDLLAWYTRVNAEHGDILLNGSAYSGE
ncbi:MAG: LTA synthase family protein, partial [Rubrobacter sp.]|nr:LTA synthase family protein [Rubrobacter sp.]